MTTLFITGATGFIGRHLIHNLCYKDFKQIYLLCRTAGKNMPNISGYDNVKYIHGDILEPESYSGYLAESDIVVHLAAVTGKVAPEKYFRVNTRGTEILVDLCRRLGISKFLYVSSIAANFKETKNYPYAKSKQKAEQLVSAAGLAYTILRPTMVIGRESPILMNLLKLANAPVVPIFGDGSLKVQPVYVEDVVSCMLHIIANDMFDNDTLEIGGPEHISIERFLARLHAQTSKRAFRPVHLPIRPVMRILESLENRFLFLLPFTAGQLASFANDGTITESPLFDRFVPDMKPIDEMLSVSLPSDGTGDIFTDLLERECEHFSQYLTGGKPDDYIKKKYVEGHKVTKLGKGANHFDTLLIKIATRNMLFTQLADVYTRVFYRNAVIRQKLVLLLAIIESCPMLCAYIDSVSEGSRPLYYLKPLAKAFLFALLLFVSAVVFLPLHALAYLPKQRFGKST